MLASPKRDTQANGVLVNPPMRFFSQDRVPGAGEARGPQRRGLRELRGAKPRFARGCPRAARDVREWSVPIPAPFSDTNPLPFVSQWTAVFPKLCHGMYVGVDQKVLYIHTTWAKLPVVKLPFGAD